MQGYLSLFLNEVSQTACLFLLLCGDSIASCLRPTFLMAADIVRYDFSWYSQVLF